MDIEGGGGSELSAQHRLYDELAAKGRVRRSIDSRIGACDVANGLLKLFEENPERLKEIREILSRPQKKQ